MTWEVTIRPLLELLFVIVGRSKSAKARAQAEAELRDVIHDLFKESPNLTRAQFKIAVARALGITSEDLAEAERMLKQVEDFEAKKKRAAKQKRPPRKKGDNPVAKED